MLAVIYDCCFYISSSCIERIKKRFIALDWVAYENSCA